jgi:hypothetical protein
MKGAFLRTSASRIATPFFCKIKGGLNKWSYLSEAIQSPFPPLIGHQKSRHINKYTYLYDYVKKKMLMLKEFFRLTDSIEKGRIAADQESETYSLHCWRHPDALYQTLPPPSYSHLCPHGVNFASPPTLSIQTGPKYESNLG